MSVKEDVGNNDKSDLDAESSKTLNTLKELLRGAVQGTMYEEHKGGSEEAEEGDGRGEERQEDFDNGSDRYADAIIKEPEGLTLVSRLRDILTGTMYQERHVAILTENNNEKSWIHDILKCNKYSIQDATSFPVKHIVVDTLENFEGLDSPVILFIVPESWATGYVGSLKYRLCIATRAISRLEFLVPWNPTGRGKDLAGLRKAFHTEVIQS